MSTTTSSILRPNPSLVDPNFDGYKLSLEKFPMYSTPNYGVDVPTLTPDQYSLQHVKSYGFHNHLVPDHWNPTSVYFINSKWQFCKVDAKEIPNLDVQKIDFVLPKYEEYKLQTNRVNSCFKFISLDLLVTTDGCGTFYILNTGDRSKKSSPWKIIFCSDTFTHSTIEFKHSCLKTPFTMLDSCYSSLEDGVHQIDCVFLKIVENDNTSSYSNKSQFKTVLFWFKLLSVDCFSWEISSLKNLESTSAPEFAFLDIPNNLIHVASQNCFKFTYASDSTEVFEKVSDQYTDDEKQNYEHTWSQSSGDGLIKIIFLLSDEDAKSKFNFSVSSSNINLSMTNGKVIFVGKFYAAVEDGKCTWSLENNRLELLLYKVDKKEVWPKIFIDDKKVKLEADNSFNRLTVSTSSGNLIKNPAFNVQELEECDEYKNETCYLLALCTKSNEVIHKINLSNQQILFSYPLSPLSRKDASDKIQIENCLPFALCLRHDVDAAIWQPRSSLDENQSLWKHTATFNAFGYVQASKQQRLFTTCAPDFSYVSVCDRNRHIYIYHQPSLITDSSFRNRKTGRKVSTIAKQHVINLESVDPVVGFYSSTDNVFVLTTNEIYTVNLVNEGKFF